MQKVKSIRLDCDEDVMLLEVEQAGGIACHTGRHSCFFQRLEGGRVGGDRSGAEGPEGNLQAMIDAEHTAAPGAKRIAARKQGDPSASYVASLFAKGQDAILKKVAEEAAETVLAAKDGDKLHIVRETADLWFHSLVLLAWHGLAPEDVLAELRRREGISGIDEKKSRKD